MEKILPEESIIYKIYLPSFQDSNDDGIGDFNGIAMRIPYLKHLGVNTLLFSPIFKTSGIINDGYDIDDFYRINHRFGTMDEFKNLLKELHKWEFKVVLALPLSSTAITCQWFNLAISSEETPYDDFYHLVSCKRRPRIKSLYGEHAFDYLYNAKKYFLHSYSQMQADLNWECPGLREEMKKILRFWLDIGVDGFYFEQLSIIFKKAKLHRSLYNKRNYDMEKLHTFLQELKQDVFSKYDSLVLGEIDVNSKEANRFVMNKELDIIFANEYYNLDHIFKTNCILKKWITKEVKPYQFKRLTAKWQQSFTPEGLKAIELENYHQPRSASRFAVYRKHDETIKMITSIAYLQKGVPVINQGQEIGIINRLFHSLDCFEDQETKKILDRMLNKYHLPYKMTVLSIFNNTPDNSRGIMQWDDTPHAGFSTNIPWIALDDRQHIFTVKRQQKRSASVLPYFEALIELRKDYPVFIYGKTTHYRQKDRNVCYFTREFEGKTAYVVINLTDITTEQIPIFPIDYTTVIFNTHESDVDDLLPYQVKVYYGDTQKGKIKNYVKNKKYL